MVTTDILYLSIDIFLDVDLVVKENFPRLSVGWYLFRVVSGSKYLPRDSIENAPYILLALATIPLLDFVMIHWI